MKPRVFGTGSAVARLSVSALAVISFGFGGYQFRLWRLSVSALARVGCESEMTLVNAVAPMQKIRLPGFAGGLCWKQASLPVSDRAALALRRIPRPVIIFPFSRKRPTPGKTVSWVWGVFIRRG